MAPPCEELYPTYDIKLACAENYICSQENQQKLLPPKLHFLTPNMHHIVCRLWGFAADPTGGAYSAPKPLSCIWGDLLGYF